MWDFSSHLNWLAESDAPTNRDGTVHKQTPILKFGGHKDEGYAIDWSPVVPGRLVSGILFNIFLLLLWQFYFLYCFTLLCFH